MTVRELQSFVQLPSPGFEPRRFSPRAGYFPMAWRDYDAPLGEPLAQQFIIRHRLIKKDPSCTHACEAVTPLQYYVDRGAPPPIREPSSKAPAGGIRPSRPPAGLPAPFASTSSRRRRSHGHPLQHHPVVDRYTRGWSYGAAVVDPRDGEIIKGNVTLGSLRGRQDYLIAQALLAPYEEGESAPDAPTIRRCRWFSSASASSRPTKPAIPWASPTTSPPAAFPIRPIRPSL